MMATDKASQQQSKTKQSSNNPLADIAGKFGGKFWLDTQSEIENTRKRDREETEEKLNTESNESN
ncbi:MAG: hypothetical protein AAGF26_12990 [Cyanobacteria bacterium P01_G01_bin.49]